MRCEACRDCARGLRDRVAELEAMHRETLEKSIEKDMVIDRLEAELREAKKGWPADGGTMFGP